MDSLAKLPVMEVDPPRQALGIPRQPTIATSATIKLRRTLESVGLAATPFFGPLQIPLDGDPEGRIAYRRYGELCAAIADALGCPTLGLEMAKGARLADLDILGEVVRYARDGLDALHRLHRYHCLLSNASRFRFEEGPDVIVVHYESPGIPLDLQRHDDDFTLAMMVLAARELTGTAWHPLAVQFAHSAPEHLTSYREVFGLIPEFDTEGTAIAFSREVLSRRFPTPVSRMERIVVETAESLLARQPTDTTPDRVREAVVDCLPSGTINLAAVADRLMVSVRTLQRDLERDGTTFRALVDEVRAAEARRLLLQSERTQTEIAFLLGFSEITAFTRAFRRWHGAPPSHFRPKL